MMGKDLRKTKSNDGEGPQKNQELWWGRTSEKPKIMGETQEKKRKIEKTPEGSIKQKKKLIKTPEWSLPEWSMRKTPEWSKYLFSRSGVSNYS
jgi:hypothetical protein